MKVGYDESHNQTWTRDRVPGSRVIATDFSDYLSAVGSEGVAP